MPLLLTAASLRGIACPQRCLECQPVNERHTISPGMGSNGSRKPIVSQFTLCDTQSERLVIIIAGHLDV